MKSGKVLLLALFVCTGVTAVFGTSGCGGGGQKQKVFVVDANISPTRLAPEALYGRWRRTGATPNTPNTPRSYSEGVGLQFDRDTTFRVFVNQDEVATTRYQVTRFSTFLGNEPQVAIDPYFPEKDAGEDGADAPSSFAPFVIASVDATHLTLVEESKEGNRYEFERVP